MSAGTPRPRVKVCAATEMALDSVRQVLVPDRAPIAVYRLADGFFATDDICTHGEANLSEGDIEGDEIVCPFHLGKFDVRTGEATAAPCVEALRRHRLVVAEDGVVYLELDEP